MKKTIILLLCCFLTISLYAQKEHLKFMGIPLNGTITQFQQKLQAKGVRYDAKSSKSIPTGCKIFKGSFSGKPADFYVYFDEKTKIVYRAKAVIQKKGSESVKSEQMNFKDLLSNKYPNHVPQDGEQGGFPAYSILLPDSQNEYLGSIDLYITDTGYSFLDDYYLHIDYTDGPNGNTHQKNNMDDL